MDQADIVVIGAGTGGAVCALTAARCGLHTVLVEQTGEVGGVAATTLMGSWANLLVNTDMQKMTGGIILEILERMVAQSATPYRTLQEAVEGKIGKPFTIPFQPVWYAQVLSEMLREAGVRLLLNTVFTGGEELPDGRKDLHFAFGPKAIAVKARVVVDATGNADVAASLGAEVTSIKTGTETYGCLMRIANVDIDKTLCYIRERRPWEPDTGFTAWLSQKMADCPDKNRRRLGYLGDPVTYDHAPMEHAKDNLLTPERFAYIEERYRREGVIYTLELCLLRQLMRTAADRGDFILDDCKDGLRGVTFNGDGIAYGGWGDGVALCNVAKPYGFNPADAEERTCAVLAARDYNIMFYRFLQKYVPGFENGYLLDMGQQTVARGSRMIVGCDDAKTLAQSPLYAQPVYIFGGIYRHQMGIPVPYGKIVSRNKVNLFAVGKCASHGMQYRSQISCMSMGVAAATAADLICSQGCTSHTLRPEELAERLKRMEVVI
ncbi:MAG: FAD-dependent oxidoreductase [Lachnospiraceae bacterium]|nr:FAD-dependent oxidoreductase [Lachnospiraceae bacterium]